MPSSSSRIARAAVSAGAAFLFFVGHPPHPPLQLVLVMEFLPGGDLLLKLSKAKRPLDDRILRQIARDICSGMAFLHQEAFVHGDLKSANVLFDAKGRAKVCRERERKRGGGEGHWRWKQLCT